MLVPRDAEPPLLIFAMVESLPNDHSDFFVPINSANGPATVDDNRWRGAMEYRIVSHIIMPEAMDGKCVIPHHDFGFLLIPALQLRNLLKARELNLS